MTTEISYDDAPVPIRDDLVAAHQRAWRRIAEPGTWLDGATRVSIAAETRHAPDCALCARRKEALSPYAVDGTHDSLGGLPERIVDIVHRIVTDSPRMQKSWYEETLASGMSETEYVEVVGVACTTISLDTFAKSMGVTPRDLPAPVAGDPSRARPAGAKPGLAWVPWVAPGDETEAEADLYVHGTSNIRRALTSVPDEQRGFFDVVNAQYLSGEHMRDLGTKARAISRSQIELVAGRVSALNQCVY